METKLKFQTSERNGRVLIPACSKKALAIARALSEMESGSVPFYPEGSGFLHDVNIELIPVGDYKFLFISNGCPSWMSASIYGAFPINSRIETLYSGTINDLPTRRVVCF